MTRAAHRRVALHLHPVHSELNELQRGARRSVDGDAHHVALPLGATHARAGALLAVHPVNLLECIKGDGTLEGRQVEPVRQVLLRRLVGNADAQ